MPDSSALLNEELAARATRRCPRPRTL
jgi:hypothetical protein